MNRVRTTGLLFVFACIMVCLAARSGAVQAAGPVANALPSPDVLLHRIRLRFRSHRPPPPYETYTLVRAQQTNYGTPDYANSYTDKYWYRSVDHAALVRRETDLGYVGPLGFQRPLFNEDRDPGPVTADIFEPAPAHALPANFVPTPEASLPPVIAATTTRAEFDYRVDSVATEGNELHVLLSPKRDPDRNRLRQLWVDAKTLDIEKVVATDKLFIPGEHPYPVLFTISFEMFDGIPTIYHIHGVVGGGYDGDGATVDYDFKDITYPVTLPSWYFDPRSYAAHADDGPE